MKTIKQNRPEDIALIADSIKGKLESAIHTINDIHERTKIISINSRIEAARVGRGGEGFKIVAHEFSNLNLEIASVANTMEEEIREELLSLGLISEAMAKDVRGMSLSRTGISVMDVIDRNLYERSCDVRWWATDSSVVELLLQPDEEKIEYASGRLGIILDSYTVYLDLVVADLDGTVIANGRPGIYKSRGNNVSEDTWFKKAMALNSGEEYALESPHNNSLVNNERVLAYSCIITDPDKAGDPVLGVLGILFNWEGLVRAVIDRVTNEDLSEDINIYKIATELWIVDGNGIVLASLHGKAEGEILRLKDLDSIVSSREPGHKIIANGDAIEIVAWGFSPGFETYRSDWYCVIRQTLKN